jgi:hypothetical protein
MFLFPRRKLDFETARRKKASKTFAPKFCQNWLQHDNWRSDRHLKTDKK